ncbi:MAG: ATP-binding protein [Desulfobacterota bacterium]|jgi:MinD superfamily P-loop ATPase|nr:ATP-binding protein [Thermodesulfobacteriota bacterium]
MKELVIISGKGGTGKTSIVAAFASLASNKVLSDADVDAADLHLIMAPQATERHDFQAGHSAVIDFDRCTACGLCRDLCRYNAIREDYTVSRMDCEGCGVCVYFCPEKAVGFPVKTCGEWYLSETRFGPMVHARLGIAEENSGKLVTLVRQEAKKVAEARNLDLILTDGPPGIGCPVIASLGGASAALIVTEPTVAGRHDMQRVAELADFFKVPVMVCVNKADLNPDSTREIRQYAEEKNYFFVGAIPFDPVFTKAMVAGQTVVEYDRHTEAAAALRQIWKQVLTRIDLQAG